MTVDDDYVVLPNGALLNGKATRAVVFLFGVFTHSAYYVDTTEDTQLNS